MVRLSLTFGELGEIYGRVVCTRGSSLISPVMFTLYSTTGTFNECDKVCMHLGSMQLDGSRTPSMDIGARSSSNSEVIGVQGHSQDR
jgi:hypothetical protein